MSSGALTRRILHWLDALVPATSRAAHLHVGARGEEEAYFHLRQQGYVMVARNYRSSRRRGEVDLIGWEGETLCFIEVKTRSRKDELFSAELAVDHEKRDELKGMARAYLRRLDAKPEIRFDVVSVYLTKDQPEITVFRAAF